MLLLTKTWHFCDTETLVTAGVDFSSLAAE